MRAAYPTQAQKQGLNGAPNIGRRCGEAGHCSPNSHRESFRRDDKGEGSAYFSSRYRRWIEPQVSCDFHPHEHSVLYCHPGLFLRTSEHRIENAQLTNAVLEGGIIDRRLRIHDSSIEAAKDLLEGVRIALRVAAR